MPDIRLVYPRGPRLWIWTTLLAVAGLFLWSTALFWGDATEEDRQVGAAVGFGEARTPVLPPQPVPLHTMTPLRTRDLGRLVHLTAVAESRVASNALWVRLPDSRRLLVRFEPPPPEGAASNLTPGSRVELDGYLGKMSRAELEVWLDTLNVSLPRPSPGVKFGDLPDPAFARVDSLFIKNFYISVRPEALERPAAAADGA